MRSAGLLLMVIAVAACAERPASTSQSPSATPPASRTSTPSASSAPTSTTRPTAATTTPSPTVSPSPSSTPSGSWQHLVDLPVDASGPLTGSSGGYVLAGWAHAGIWFSADGIDWQSIALPLPTGCAAEVNDVVEFERVGFMAVGELGECPDGGAPDAAAWFSRDGLQWAAAAGLPATDGRWFDAASLSPWRVEDDWEALLAQYVDTGERWGHSVWRSRDGQRWEREAVVTLDGLHGWARGSPDGTRVFGVDLGVDPGFPARRLVATDDFINFREIEPPVDEAGSFGSVVAPRDDIRSSWVLGYSTGAANAPGFSETVWVSPDLETWTKSNLADLEFAVEIVPLGRRYLAGTPIDCVYYNDPCAPRWFVSDDGLAWHEIATFATGGSQIVSFADGPAGLLSVATALKDQSATGVSVWRYLP